MTPGQYYTLTVKRFTAHGAYLINDQGEETLLPNAYLTKDTREGDEMTVFVYQDHEHRITATTLKPKLVLGEIAYLKVKSITSFGAFIDWGLPKDLFVPNREQKKDMEEGRWYFVYLTMDELTKRLNGSAKIDHLIKNETIELQPKQEVSILIHRETNIGYEVIINYKYWGLVYKNEVFSDLRIGEKKKGFIKEIREDHKIDVSLQPQGYEHISSFTATILEKLKEHEGFLALTDQSSPEKIAYMLGMSKKNFKKAIGSLFKAGKITLLPEGIQSIEKA